MEYLERAFDDAKYGRASEHPYAEVMFPTAHEPRLAPDGKHIMMAFTQYGPIELRDGSWETERDAYAQRVIDELARYAPRSAGHDRAHRGADARRTSRIGSGCSAATSCRAS